MRIPSELSTAFQNTLEGQIAAFCVRNDLIPDDQALGSNRFLSRSVVPHIEKLSALFNRVEGSADEALDPYWKESSRPENLRLAYFLYFMPCNLYRMASVWTELARLGFQWSAGDTLRGIEYGAGPAPGACATATAQKIRPSLGLPSTGNWALIEQDKAMLELGTKWAEDFLPKEGAPDWSIRPFHRKIQLSATPGARAATKGREGLLPKNAPSFNLWLLSFFLNEFPESPAQIAQMLVDTWEKHLDEEGIAILVEPALRLQSRKLLEIRRELLVLRDKGRCDWLQVLLPCLGHQACGALASPDDWCHEEVSWWRPGYIKKLDQLAGLDRKSLPFSYLVIARSQRKREEILPMLKYTGSGSLQRLVSPSHHEGREQEFFLCGPDGKSRARYRVEEELERGDILCGAEMRGDTNAKRIQRVAKVL